MYSHLISLNTNVNPYNLIKGRSYGDSIFLGERISIKSRDYGRVLWRSLRIENDVRKAKTGVVHCVQTPTSENDDPTVRVFDFSVKIFNIIFNVIFLIIAKYLNFKFLDGRSKGSGYYHIGWWCWHSPVSSY